MKLHWICAIALALTGCSTTEQAASGTAAGSYLLVLNKADVCDDLAGRVEPREADWQEKSRAA